MALLPVPLAWRATRDALAALAPDGVPRRDAPAVADAIARAYGLAPATLAPLLRWQGMRAPSLPPPRLAAR